MLRIKEIEDVAIKEPDSKELSILRMAEEIEKESKISEKREEFYL